jgi:hypothetical protein
LWLKRLLPLVVLPLLEFFFLLEPDEAT